MANQTLPIAFMMGHPEQAGKLMDLWRRSHPSAGDSPKPKAKAKPKEDQLARKASVWQSLWSKVHRGFGTPGEGSVAWGAMPDSVRQAMGAHVDETKDQGPPIGWVPSQLSPEERLLLAQLQARAQEERQPAMDEARQEAMAQMQQQPM